MMDEHLPAARVSDDTHPRPQMARARWADLSGTWEFTFDDDDRGVRDGWPRASMPFDRSIIVPFPPESRASGIGDTSFHGVLWYRRSIGQEDLAEAGHTEGNSLLLHFGAVDYEADVWADGLHLAHHEGGHTPFTVELPPIGTGGASTVVVRVRDDPEDLAQPRGKQDWQPEPHAVWYDRTSGIWQTVWLESVPPLHLTHVAWRPDAAAARVHMDAELSRRPRPGTQLRVRLSCDGTPLAEGTAVCAPGTARTALTLDVDALRNGQDLDRYLWCPEHPVLIDAEVALVPPGGAAASDVIASYFGFRSVGTDRGRFLLNDRPHPIRAVLSQGFWPRSHLAAPDADALRAEVQLIRDLGFTTARIHQKIEDPRFLYWADRLGLMVWEEMPSVYEFGARSTRRLLDEWQEAIHRDASHPCIVAWVPFNESWGVQHVAIDGAQKDLLRAAYHLTRSLDPTRLVISNDGWEHTGSDLLTLHDYENDPRSLLACYGTFEARARWIRGIAPNGRRVAVGTPEEQASTLEQPVVLSEFGGVSLHPDHDGAWGYSLVGSVDELEQHLRDLFGAVRRCAGLAGWCFTQLTDTQQETNGLTDADRVPKIPLDRLRAIIVGEEHPLSDAPDFG